MSSYRDYESKLGPAWLQGPNGAAFMAELGGIKDDVLERIRQAVQVAFPDRAPGVPPADLQPSMGTDSALDHVGADRLLPRAAAESPSDWDPTKAGTVGYNDYGQGPNDQAYAARLKAAPTTWAAAGSAYAMLTALANTGIGNAYPNSPVIVTHNGRYYQLNGTTLVIGAEMTCINRATKTGALPTAPGYPGWTFDARDQMWTQFGILFPNDLPALYANTPAGRALRDSLAQLVELWRPAKAVYRGSWIFASGKAWGWPVATKWGDVGLKWGGNIIHKIPPDDGLITGVIFEDDTFYTVSSGVETVKMQTQIDFTKLPAGNLTFDLSGFLSVTGLQTGTYRLLIGGTSNTVDGTAVATLTSRSIAGEQKTGSGTIANPGGTQYVKVTLLNGLAATSVRIDRTTIAFRI